MAQILIHSAGEHFVDASFTTIIGYGSNGAIIHYRPSMETNTQILNDNLLLVDSGGLYMYAF